MDNLHDFYATTLTGQEMALRDYRGKLALVVNTASKCTFTPQYEGLQELHKAYCDYGLEVLAFPCNQFGQQEPGGAEEIGAFCQMNYGVSFPMFAKSGVSEGDANPFYASLAKKTGERPHWNFHKYLIDRSGETVLSFGSAVEPADRKLATEIERMLAASGR